MSWKCPTCPQENSDTAHFCSGCGAPNPAASAPMGQANVQDSPIGQTPGAPPPPAARGGSGKKVLIVIGLAVVLLFCCIAAAIISAIALPNILDKIQQAKQKKAMVEMKSLAVAIQSWSKDNGGLFPDTGHQESMYYTTVDAEKLAPFLVPKYAASIPTKDPWEHPYQYGVSPDDGAYILICPGKDGKTNLEQVPEEPLETHCYEDDILWENERFLQAPGGQQKGCE